MPEYVNFLPGFQAGLQAAQLRATIANQREQTRLQAQRFLQDQLEARQMDEYRQRMATVQEGEERRAAELFNVARNRERIFEEAYQQRLGQSSGGTEWSGREQSFVPRAPTWRDEQDALYRALIASKNFQGAANVMAGRNREELADINQQNRISLANVQNENRMEVERLKNELALTRYEKNKALDPRLGFVNVIDEVTQEVKGRIYPKTEEELKRLLGLPNIAVPDTEDDGTTKPKEGVKELPREQALKFFNQAGGNKEKARELARKAGYTF